MNRLGKYCKAYLIDDLRKFSGWNENAREEQAQGALDETKSADEVDLRNTLFLQENYTVTGGIFLDENIVFDKTTPEWIQFCRDTLKFEPAAVEPSAETPA